VLGPHGALVSGSQILPVIIGEDGAAMALGAALQQAGFDVRGIRPPTVPPGTARLRLAITVNLSEDEITGLGEAMREVSALVAQSS
jgi:8-amino-7-oxononanoate synthase